MLTLSRHDDVLQAVLVPPQTVDDPSMTATKGAYCFVIDVSGSMNAPAEVTNDDGDRVNHGWSQLDIGKHSTNAFISSLDENDWVSIVTYSDAAKVVLEWTRCDEQGLLKARAAVDALQPERSTNLMAGMTKGFEVMGSLPVAEEVLHEYALGLIITTDGMPSDQWHPARGKEGYGPLWKSLMKKFLMKRKARFSTTTIGLGYSLDSALLTKMSDQFLHMPDPGSVGPFMVNLCAALRCTARFPAAAGAAVNQATLVLSPSSAVEGACLPGYETCSELQAGAMRVDLGMVCYDQPRHMLIPLKPGAEPLQVSIEMRGAEACSASSQSAAVAAADEPRFLAQQLRLKAVTALGEVLAGDGAAAPAEQLVATVSASPAKDEDDVSRLKATFEDQVLLGCSRPNWRKWGVHYVRTLQQMLRSERRSNFRDQALQNFGHDAQGREALFESQSNDAEMNFATLKAPEPSLLGNASPAVGTPVVAPVVGSSAASVVPPPAAPRVLPAEFMRGGGCFAPEAEVLARRPDGSVERARIDGLRAGDVVVTADGGSARVRCVVATECAGGRAMFSRFGGGLEVTEWHPVLDGRGRWRFPVMLGERVLRPCAAVFNLVLERGHVIDVNGVRCVTLAHGLTGEVVGHPYWGTAAVLRDLQAAPGWQAGHVFLRSEEALGGERRTQPHTTTGSCCALAR